MESNFNLYSEYYDLLYNDKDYNSEAGYISDCIKSNFSHANSILEFGSGTGRHGFSFKYVCFIKWRGSNDNEIQFSTNKPQSNCGAVVNDTAFIFSSLKKDLTKGEVLKENFTKTFDSYASYILINVGEDSKKINAPWNAAIRIDEIGEKTVKGKIAICFKDEKKSWVAGKFEAILCNN